MTREEKLIQQMKNGDAGAVEELIEMFYDEILRYCRFHVPNPSLAEDAAQETFLKVIRFHDHYTGSKGKWKPFLYQIAANTCIDIGRKNRFSDVSLEQMTEEFACAEKGYENVRSALTLRQLTADLPDHLREPVLLKYGQDLTLREIAQTLNLPLRTVQSRLRAALKKLKEAYSEHLFR